MSESQCTRDGETDAPLIGPARMLNQFKEVRLNYGIIPRGNERTLLSAAILKGLVQKDEGIVRFYKWDLAQLAGLS